MGLFDFLKKKKSEPAKPAQPARPAQPAPAPRIRGPLYVYMDIDKLGGGAYGLSAGQAVAKAVPASMMNGMSILSGDSNATLRGSANEYVIGLRGSDTALDAVEDKLRADSTLKAVLSRTGIRRGAVSEPLVADGTVQGGTLVNPPGHSTSFCGLGFRDTWKRQEEQK